MTPVKTGREIAFRVWDKDLCEYVTGSEFGFARMSIRPDDDNGRVFSFDTLFPGRYTFEQFTGLYDKNHRAIYEGDMISEFGGALTGEVAYVGGEWRVLWTDIFGGSSRLCDELFRCEVIGSLHEVKCNK